MQDSDRALDLFAQYLEREVSEGLDFQSFVREHPGETKSLLRLHEDWIRGQRGLATPTESATWVAGSRLGEFMLVRKLGRGGQAVVWEADQPRLHRRVALKVRPTSSSVRDRELFSREARAGARLSHDGVVRVYDHGESDGHHWIAQELIPGGRSVRHLVDEVHASGEVPPDWARRVARLVAQVARALGAAHAAGVIHRDVKPQNIMLLPDGRPKVADFGLARLEEATALTQTGQVLGTYYYMSPEQVESKRGGVDQRSDVFSLGVVLYEMLTLVRPFQGDAAHQICSRILEQDPVEPRVLRSQVPGDLSVICIRALEKRRDRRYPDMAAFAGDLERFLDHRPIVARPPSPLEQWLKWTRRNPVLSTGIGMGGVSLIVVSWLLVQLAGTNHDLEFERNAAHQRAQEVLRLALRPDYERLVLRAADLWPARADLLPSMTEWMSEAKALISELPTLRASRRTVLEEARGEQLDASSVSGREADWWLEELDGLIRAIESLGDSTTGLAAEDSFHPEYGWSLPRRIRFAHDWKQLRAGLGPYASGWAAALPALQEDYPHLQITPQSGLVPLGRVEGSLLWEFWHPQSGVRPRRAPNGSDWELTPETGIVLVLLPAAEGQLGAQSADPDRPNYDPEAAPNEQPYEVALEAYFISRHELTETQWSRAMGAIPTPEEDASGGSSLPVSFVSWRDSTECARRFGLTLPTEAQWEYAARAGTTWPWWSGPEKASIDNARAGNVSDATYRDWAREQAFSRTFEPWADGYAGVADIASFQPNAFGLYDTIGNVSEWTADSGNPDRSAPLRRRDGLRLVPPATDDGSRARRGGNFYWHASIARVSRRTFSRPEYRDRALGVRLARPWIPEEAKSSAAELESE